MIELSMGSSVGTFGPFARCWNAIGPVKDVFERHLRHEILTILEESFDSVADSDLFTVLLYMIGRSVTTAKPTVLFISRRVELRKAAKKVMKESGVFRRYPDFRPKYADKIPGMDGLDTLALEPMPKASAQTLETIEVLYDASRPIISMGIPIFIQHSGSLRPGTANAIRLGDQLFLQTVQHAFRAHIQPQNIAPSASVGEDLVIDSDSESEDDSDDDDEHVGVTSAGSQSFNTLSNASSHRDECSRYSSSIAITPPMSVDDNLWGCGSRKVPLSDRVEDRMTSMDDAMATLDPLVGNNRRFPPLPLLVPNPKTLVRLGELLDSSIENDWALIKITSPEFKAALHSFVEEHNSESLAYDNIALQSHDGTDVYTFTASGGMLRGKISGSANYTRLPYSTTFRKMFVIKFDGPLANGDCGSAVLDANTGTTYGHLVAGCKTTGTAYILAASQVNENHEAFLSDVLKEEHQTLRPDSRLQTPDSRCTLQQRNHSRRGIVDDLIIKEARTYQLEQAKTSSCNELSMCIENDVRYPLHKRKRPRRGTRAKKTSLANASRQVKKWREVFFTRRPFNDSPFFEARKSIPGYERQRGSLDAFFEDTETSVPSWESSLIQKVLQRPCEDLARARLDDREYGSERRRPHPQWLTPSQLRRALSLKRFGLSNLPQANRRLIYIHRPDPEYMVALIDSVYCHQADSLRDTLFKHFAFEASVKVIVPLSTMFVLEFHLPYLSLRGHSTTFANTSSDKSDHPSYAETDVSFLAVECAQHKDSKCACKHVMTESQISIVICGWDNQNWVAWGLFNTPAVPTEEFDPDEECHLQEDFFAADGDSGPVIDADRPIWDPRAYWLRIIDIRTQSVLKEWTWLVRNVEAGARSWKRKHPVLLANHTGGMPGESTEELFGWTIQTMQLLRQIRTRLTSTVQALERFVTPEGDQSFFLDMRDRGSILALQCLKRSFQGLSDLQQEVSSLDTLCKESQNILSLCLERQTQLIHTDTQKMSYHVHTLNLQTNAISREIQELNRKSTEAALGTVRAAKDTSRSTRAHILVIWITTPLILALQFFGTERHVFPFERNPKSFMIAVFVLIFALPCLSYGLGWIGGFVERLTIRGKSENKDRGSPDALTLQAQYRTVASA